MIRVRLLALLGLSLLLPAATALAQGDYELRFPVGVRAGWTEWENRGQVHLGAHVALGEMMENLYFTPNLELGFGGGSTVAAFNGDVTWSFSEMATGGWGLYAGGSLGLIWADPEDKAADADLGLSVLAGLTRRFTNGHDGFLEVRAGVLDSPGLKVTFGYNLF
ncbi:MAG: hypothetical protein IPK64_04655 [bacterium]|nr:hypothetical protein [bacterium]